MTDDVSRVTSSGGLSSVTSRITTPVSKNNGRERGGRKDVCYKTCATRCSLALCVSTKCRGGDKDLIMRDLPKPREGGGNN